MENEEKKRTNQQSRALHLYLTKLSDCFNDLGLDVHIVLKEGISTNWTPTLVKELLWRQTQIAMFGKKSTTQLSKTGEIDQIVDTINLHLSERFAKIGYEYIEFPNWESLMNQEDNKILNQ